MKTLSITLMILATGFGIFNLINAKKSGAYDKLYAEPLITSTVSMKHSTDVGKGISPKEIISVKDKPVNDSENISPARLNKKISKEEINDESAMSAELTPAIESQFDSVYTIDEIEDIFGVDVDTLKNVEEFDFNLASFSRAIPSKEEEKHYSQAAKYIKKKVLELQAKNKATVGTVPVIQ